jgi:hypothetical protein
VYCLSVQGAIDFDLQSLKALRMAYFRISHRGPVAEERWRSGFEPVCCRYFVPFRFTEHLIIVTNRIFAVFITANTFIGITIAQAVSRQLPTVAARVRSQVRSCGICDAQSGTGASFLRLLPFPLSILIPPTAPHRYNRPNSDRRTKWTQFHPTP